MTVQTNLKTGFYNIRSDSDLGNSPDEIGFINYVMAKFGDEYRSFWAVEAMEFRDFVVNEFLEEHGVEWPVTDCLDGFKIQRRVTGDFVFFEYGGKWWRARPGRVYAGKLDRRGGMLNVQFY